MYKIVSDKWNSFKTEIFSLTKSMFVCILFYFYSHLLYGCLVWQYTSKSNLHKISVLQKKCLRIISFSQFNDRSNPLFILFKILKLENVLHAETLKFFIKLHLNRLPTSLSNLFKNYNINNSHNTRHLNNLPIPQSKSVRYGKNCLVNSGASYWNKFFDNLKDKNVIVSINRFKQFFKKACISQYVSLEPCN